MFRGGQSYKNVKPIQKTLQKCIFIKKLIRLNSTLLVK
jgi:hypothetical protein